MSELRLKNKPLKVDGKAVDADIMPDLEELLEDIALTPCGMQAVANEIVDGVPAVDFVGSTIALSKPLVGRFTWQEAMSLRVAGWRLPTIEELSGLWHEANISGFAFEDTLSCWSSSPVADDSHDAWQFGFYFGDGYRYFRYGRLNVRLVRG